MPITSSRWMIQLASLFHACVLRKAVDGVRLSYRPFGFPGLLLVACLFVWTLPAFAADRLLSPQFVRTEFTVDNGLPDNTIDTITETDNGLLWLGTGSGLASFDGRTFTTVRLRFPGARLPGRIHSLVVGGDGDLWVGSDAGVVRVPKSDLDDSDLPHTTSFLLGDENGEEVQVLFKSHDGTIWAGTVNGLYRFNGQRFLCVDSSGFVGRIREALDGRLLLNTSAGVAEFDGKRLVRRVGLGAKLRVPDDQIFDAYQDANGTMWYPTGMGLRSISARNGEVRSYGADHVPAFRVYADREGALWSSGQFGVFKIVDGHMWTPAPDLMARYFYAGRDGDLWIARLTGGLVHLLPRKVQMYTKADGLQSDATMAVLPAHDGRLWVGGNCGLAVFDGSHFKTFDEKDGLSNACVWSLAEDHSHAIWIGTWGGGLYRFRDGQFLQFSIPEGLASNIVTQVIVARDNSIWVATPRGVSHLLNGEIRNFDSSDGLANLDTESIHQDISGTIWVATLAGVQRFVGEHFESIGSTKGAEDELPRHFVETLDGRFYTTNLPQGISTVKNGQIKVVNASLGMIEGVESADHSLWFSSHSGVVRIPGREFMRMGISEDPLGYEIFNLADGLNTTEASSGSPNIAMAASGILWVATVKGLARIETARLPSVARAVKVFVAGSSIDSANRAVGRELDLSPGIHHVELHLAAIYLANPEKIRLQYRLQGVDSNWLDGTSTRTAIYSNVPVGRHPLLVRATNSIGQWSAPEAIYEVVQEPHFYAQPLFQVCCGIAFLLLSVLFYVTRMRQVVQQTYIILEQRQLERDAVARDLHDTFLQGIQGLILHFHIGTQQLPVEDPVRHSFEEALQTSDRILLEGREVLSRLRTREVKAETLIEAYAAIGKEFSALSPAKFEVVILGQRRALGSVLQEELKKIGREAIFNSYTHAKASRIEVELNFGLLEFTVRFRDDGIGIDPEVLRKRGASGHYGLPGICERVSQISGRMELRTRAGAGTEIEIRIPSRLAYRTKPPRFKPGRVHQFFSRMLKRSGSYISSSS